MFPMVMPMTYPRTYAPRRRFPRYRRTFRKRVWGKPRFKRAFYKCRNNGGNFGGCLKRAKRVTRVKWYWKRVQNAENPIWFKAPKKGYALVWKDADVVRQYAVRAPNGVLPDKYRGDGWNYLLPNEAGGDGEDMEQE